MFYGSLALACAFAVSQSPVSAQTQTRNLCDNSGRQFGNVQVLAQVPFPGYPEGIAVKNGKAYVASGVAPYSSKGQDIPFPSNEQSMIFEFDVCTGEL